MDETSVVQRSHLRSSRPTPVTVPCRYLANYGFWFHSAAGRSW